ncbi:hypothetical protein Gohar_010093 [Gossypium harknessii]|uniref:Uncharacterized protein n=2 Tax=Gossypium TaxID=3633 RepID=A0A7J9J665_9ROSI|nr:hypothetical protein [Gossypium harknessii]MBA0829364.1 hypothetical protein [Gossypium armourianum]
MMLELDIARMIKVKNPFNY